MKKTNKLKTIENRHNINELITFSSEEMIVTAESFKAVKKHKLAAKCTMAKMEMLEAHKIFNEKTNEFFNLSQELDNMEA